MSQFLPLVANWVAPVRETYSFLTEIFESRSGKEQRRAHRVNPRRDVSFNYLVASSSIRALHAALNLRDADEMSIPDFTSIPVFLAQGAEVEETVIEVEGEQTWVNDVQSIAFVNGLRCANSDVSDYDTGTLTVPALTEAWPAGTPVYPLITGRLSPDIAMDYDSAAVARGAAVFRQTRGTEFISTIAPPQLAGKDLFDFAPNWTTRPSATFSSPEEEVDFNKGVTKTFKPIAFNRRRLQFTYLGMKRPEVERLRDFFWRQKGRRGEFWCPSFVADMEVTVGVNAGDTGFRVLGTDIPAAFNDTVHQAVCVNFSDGTRHFSTIAGMVVENTPIGNAIIGDFNDDFNEDFGGKYGLLGQQTYIQIDDAFLAARRKDEISSVSWLYMSRFASDDLTIEWMTSAVAGIVVNVTSLERL